MRLMILLFIFGCGCPAEVIDTLPDGGVSATYCGVECDGPGDCGRGSHCSLHPTGQRGICFLDFDGGSR